MYWLIGASVILIGFAVGGLAGAPWVPMRKADVDKLLDDVEAVKKSHIYIIELGCGDGRLLSAAAKRGMRGVGYEINPFMWFIAWLRNIKHYPRIRVRLGNFWKIRWSDADVVITFLVPHSMDRLEKKAAEEMPNGTRLISYVFRLPHKKPAAKHGSWYIYKY